MFKFDSKSLLTLISATLIVSLCQSVSVRASLPPGEAVIAMLGEPPNLDHSKTADQDSSIIEGHIFEGLTRFDKDNKIIPGVAERWKIDSQKATFFLRKNAKWSDGKPVTANDFVFSWRRIVDPKTAGEYAFILYPVKNAEAINTKKISDVSSLGVRAIGDYVFEVTFEKPCGYFLSLTTFSGLAPLREDFVKAQGDKYAADAANMIFNGPFKLVKWTHGAELRMEKNEHYWNKDIIKLKALHVAYITSDDMARFNLFKDGKTSYVNLTKDMLPIAQKENFRLKKFAEGSLFYMQFNFREGRILNNKNLRKALKFLVNADEYVTNVVGIPGTTPGRGLIPQWMTGVKRSFREEHPIPAMKQNIAEAKKYFALAMKELKLSEPPTLVWLCGDNIIYTREAEYFQAVFKKELGIDLKIDKQTFKQKLAKERTDSYDIVSSGWGPDFNDPLTFVDLFSSWNENNKGKWKSAKYDVLVRKALNTVDPKSRMDAFADAEEVLMDELPMVPLYERTLIYTHSNNIDGITRRSVGFDPDFTYAYTK